MKKISISILTFVLPIIIFGQNYSCSRIEKLVENLTELSTDYDSGNFVGSEFIKDTTYSVIDNWTDITIYENEIYVDNKTHKVFLKIVKKAKINDLIVMTENTYPNIRVYGFWALVKRNEKESIKNVLDMKTPAEAHNFSTRPFPETIQHFDYNHNYKVIKVTQNGAIRWRSYYWVYLTIALKGKYVGVEELGNGIWKVFYRNVFLGFFNERELRNKELNIRLETNLV